MKRFAAVVIPLAFIVVAVLGCSVGDIYFKNPQQPSSGDDGADGPPLGGAGKQGGGGRSDVSFTPNSGSGGPMELCPSGDLPCADHCCTVDEICQHSECVALGPPCDELWPCPNGFGCDAVLGRCIEGAQRCEYRPAIGEFEPAVEWAWTSSDIAPDFDQVMMTPMVANFTDDNGDGAIDRHDIPDVVFTCFAGSKYREPGVIRVVSGKDGVEHFAITGYDIAPNYQIAVGDIDNDLKPDIVACLVPRGVIAFAHNGDYKWHTPDVKCLAPALADLDGDNSAEVVTCAAALNGKDGSIRWRNPAECFSYPAVADIDGDNHPEVITGIDVFSWDGQLKWSELDPALRRGFKSVAIADLDGDGDPEVVVVHFGGKTASLRALHDLRAFHHDGTPYWGPVDINQGHANLDDKCGGCGGGPPTIADFDGDGQPEIAAAAGYGYVIFEHDGTPKWFSATQDLSSRVTGSSVFDFEGDGHAEAVYNDENLLRIYDGTGGDVLFQRCNTSGTLYEYPVIVDVDNDDHAEIVVAGNNYAFKHCDTADGSVELSSTGIKVFGDVENNWVRTRRIWNQHTYHVTNIDEDGRVPAVEIANWRNPNLNNFRQNIQPGGLFDAPDLTAVAHEAVCRDVSVVTVEVVNRGAAKVMPGTEVTLFVRHGSAVAEKLETKVTQSVLYPGQSELVAFSFLTNPAFQGDEVIFSAVVDDDGSGNGRDNECDETNNRVVFEETICQHLF